MKKTVQIKHNESGKKVKEILKDRLHLPRREITRLMHEQGIQINNDNVPLTFIVKENDILTVSINDTDALHLGYRPETAEILYEDENFIIVNKPAGIPSHPSHEYPDSDMGTILKNTLQDDTFIIRIPGRLDKDVSGCLAFAKTKEALSIPLTKTYLAVVKGHMEEKEGTHIFTLSKKNRRSEVDEAGKKCITHYQVLQENEKYSLLSIQIETGRTHQIRAGFASLGHPLAGDSKYGGKDNAIRRPALHCYRISRETGSVTCPLPDDMEALVKDDSD